jgi:hypothetical protein
MASTKAASETNRNIKVPNKTAVGSVPSNPLALRGNFGSAGALSIGSSPTEHTPQPADCQSNDLAHPDLKKVTTSSQLHQPSRPSKDFPKSLAKCVDLASPTIVTSSPSHSQSRLASNFSSAEDDHKTVKSLLPGIKPLDCLYVDVFPMSRIVGMESSQLSTPGGHTHCMVVVDVATTFCMAFLLSSVHDASGKLSKWIRILSNHLDTRLKAIRLSDESYFLDDAFLSLMADQGTLMMNLCSFTSEHQYVVDKTLEEITKHSQTLLQNANAPPHLAGHAFTYSSVLWNHSIPRIIADKEPIWALLEGKSNQLTAFVPSKAMTFGCDAFVHVQSQRRGKFDGRAQPGIYIGYSSRYNAHRILMLDTLQQRIERSVKFVKNSFSHLSSVKDEIVEKSARLSGELSDGERKWEVDRIINDRKVRGKQQYLVQWKGNYKPTWESDRYLLEDCPDVIKDYLAERTESR